MLLALPSNPKHTLFLAHLTVSVMGGLCSVHLFFPRTASSMFRDGSNWHIPARAARASLRNRPFFRDATFSRFSQKQF